MMEHTRGLRAFPAGDKGNMGETRLDNAQNSEWSTAAPAAVALCWAAGIYRPLLGTPALLYARTPTLSAGYPALPEQTSSAA